MFEKGKCVKCLKSMPKIGLNRKNGKKLNNKNGKDWEDRQLHKKCFKELKDYQMRKLDEFYDNKIETKKFCVEFRQKYNLKKLL